MLQLNGKIFLITIYAIPKQFLHKLNVYINVADNCWQVHTQILRNWSIVRKSYVHIYTILFFMRFNNKSNWLNFVCSFCCGRIFLILLKYVSNFCKKARENIVNKYNKFIFAHLTSLTQESICFINK